MRRRSTCRRSSTRWRPSWPPARNRSPRDNALRFQGAAMSLSMYEISVPVILRGLGQLEHVLGKAIAHARSSDADPDQYVQARLAPDMFTLAGQVQRASDTAKATIARVTGTEAPGMPDDESTMEQLI